MDWDVTLFSERLVGLARENPDGPGLVRGTGNLFYSQLLDQWYVEFEAEDGELFPIYTQELDRLARAAAREAGNSASARCH
jgi:hypothetical protein